MNDKLHPLLRRQLARARVSAASAPGFEELVAEVERAYRQFDSDRELLERSLELTSHELVESRQALTAALGASGIAIWSWAPSRDEAMIEGYPSPLPGSKFGRSQGPSSSFLDFVHPTARARVESALALALERRTEVQERFPLAGSSPTRHVELRGRVDPDSNGTRLTGVLRDVSDDVEAERAQEQRQEELRRHSGAIRQLTEDLASRWGDLDECLRVITERASEALGVERASVWLVEADRLVLANLYERTPRAHSAGATLARADNPRYFEALHEARVIVADDAATHPTTADFRESYLSRFGIGSMLDSIARVGGVAHAVVCHEHVGAPRRWSFREQAVAGTMADFVALALESARRRRAEGDLEAQRAFLRQVIDLDPNLIFAREADGRLTLVNQSFASLAGASVADLLAGRAGAAALDELKRADDEVFATGEERVLPDVELDDASGRRRCFQVTKRPILDADGVVRRVLGVATDLTERRHAEEAQHRLEESLRQAQKIESLGLLAGGVAHDFNNLLMPIITLSQAIIDELPPGSSMAEDLKDVSAAGQRARDITAQLLAFGRKQVFDLAVVDIDEQLRSTHRLLVRLVPENVTIDLALAAGRAAQVDATQFQQVLINLVANARDAMPNGGSIRIATRKLGAPGVDEIVEIEISDTGSGIEAHHLAHVFEPFYSTKRQGSGTGLGLATAHGIIEQHGGTIRVKSELGRGSTFTITLPATDLAPVLHGEPSRPPPRGIETVLVCEDDDAVRRVVVRELQRRGGYRVLAAASGEEALALLDSAEGQSIDLLVTDVVLTGMSGPDLARAANRGGRNLPRLFMSGHAHGVLAPSGVLDPGTRMLQKPFATGELLRAVRELLDARG